MSRGRGTIYLLHFDRPYRHAAHYTGWTDDLPARLAAHAAGRGARLLQVVTDAGIGWRLARTWPGSRDDERALKRQGGASRRCPDCGVTPRARTAGALPAPQHRDSAAAEAAHTHDCTSRQEDPMTDDDHHTAAATVSAASPGPPSIQEIAELTARLRRLSAIGRYADPAERAATLADKDAMLARIARADRPAVAVEPQAQDNQAEDNTDSGETAAPPGGWSLPDGWPLPPEMVDGIEERRTRPAAADDPAELAARLADLRQRTAGHATAGRGAGATADAEDVRAAELTHWAQQDERAVDDPDVDDDGEGWSR